MVNNLLISFTETLGVGAIGLILGMLIVFLGITVLVLMIKLLGAVLDKDKKKGKTQENKTATVPAAQEPAVEEGITDEVKAAIIAAISAYYFGENTKTCEFKVKKIKKY